MRSRIVPVATERAREGVLTYRVLARHEPRPGAAAGAVTLLEVTPRTGRHHQIRLQLSAAGHPIVGDMKYGGRVPLADKSIALHAVRLRFPHPVRDEIIDLSAAPEPVEPWIVFARDLERVVPNAPE